MMTFSSATKRRLARRQDDDLAARQPLADVVVRVAFEAQRDAARHERAEALAGRPGELQAESCRRAALGAAPPRHLGTEHRADRRGSTLRIGSVERHRASLLERLAAAGDQLVVERAASRPWSCARTCRRGAAGRHLRLVQHGREVEPARLPVLDRRPHVEAIDAADHLVHRAEAERRHVLAHFLGDEAEEVDDELRLAGEVRAQLRILRRDADRTGVEMADAHHHAARHDERRGGEAELLGAEQRGDDDVAAGLELAVDLHDDAVAQPLQQQHLLRLGEPELPRHAGVLDAGQRRGAGAAVVAGDQDDVGVRLGDAGRDRADAGDGHELDVRSRARGFAFFRS